MPNQQALPTWLAINGANFQSPSGLADQRTGQPIFAGGLNLGDYFDMTEAQANALSNTAVGLCHAGRYRMVQVAAAATAANVKVGTAVGYAPGSSVQAITLLTAGSGQTPGTYNITGSGGSPTTSAVIQVVVTAAGTVTAPPTVITPGQGYGVTQPTFTVAAGGTPATLGVQMNLNLDIVTSYDASALGGASSVLVRGVFLNSITPGNYGFIQEAGLATILVGTATQTTAGSFAFPTGAGAGVFTTSTAGGGAANTGFLVDVSAANALARINMNLPDFVE